MRDFKEVLEAFKIGDHISDEELEYLLDLYMRVGVATRIFPEYEATRFHALTQVSKLQDMKTGRKRFGS